MTDRTDATSGAIDPVVSPLGAGPLERPVGKMDIPGKHRLSVPSHPDEDAAKTAAVWKGHAPEEQKPQPYPPEILGSSKDPQYAKDQGIWPTSEGFEQEVFSLLEDGSLKLLWDKNVAIAEHFGRGTPEANACALANALILKALIENKKVTNEQLGEFLAAHEVKEGGGLFTGASSKGESLKALFERTRKPGLFSRQTFYEKYVVPAQARQQATLAGYEQWWGANSQELKSAEKSGDREAKAKATEKMATLLHTLLTDPTIGVSSVRTFIDTHGIHPSPDSEWLWSARDKPSLKEALYKSRPTLRATMLPGYSPPIGGQRVSQLLPQGGSSTSHPAAVAQVVGDTAGKVMMAAAPQPQPTQQPPSVAVGAAQGKGVPASSERVREFRDRLARFDTLTQKERTKFYENVKDFEKNKKLMGELKKYPAECDLFVSIQSMVRFNQSLDALEVKGEAWSKNKAQVYRMAFVAFVRQGLLESPEPRTLEPADRAQFDPQNPTFLNATFQPKDITITSDTAFYDYKEQSDGRMHFWTDFANICAGGGFLEEGMVQEEIMLLEMPGLAKFLSEHLSPNSTRCSLLTRLTTSGNGIGAGKAIPNPVIFSGVHRTVAVKTTDEAGNKTGVYGDAGSMDPTKYVEIKDPPQTVNLLMMAAPKLNAKTPAEQHAPKTIQDLLGTFMAGFSQVANQPPPGQKKIVETGAIGAGVFNNDVRTVYFLQCLAAEQNGVDVKFWGIRGADDLKWEWETVIKPQLKGKSLQECVTFLSTHL